MFKIADGRDRLYQWDSNVKLIIDKTIADGIDEAHFTAKFSRDCLTVQVIHDDDESYVMIPNVLLQQSYDLVVYAYCCTDLVTKHTQEIPVTAKPKPADYVYTETEVLNYWTLAQRLDKLESSGGVVNGIPSGGKAGQFLCKNSDEDYDVSWKDFEIPDEYGLVTYNQDKTITIT